MNTIEPGTKISWVSLAGILEGTVKSVKIVKNASETMVPFMIIENVIGRYDRVKHSNVFMAATDSYMKIMKVEIDSEPVNA
jgi:hypothetical protein